LFNSNAERNVSSDIDQMDRENSGPRLIDPGGIYFDEYGNLVEAQNVNNRVKELALEST
jgi:hypothetical protein